MIFFSLEIVLPTILIILLILFVLALVKMTRNKRVECGCGQDDHEMVAK